MEPLTQYRDVKTVVATVFKSTSPQQAIFRKEGESARCGSARTQSPSRVSFAERARQSMAKIIKSVLERFVAV